MPRGLMLLSVLAIALSACAARGPKGNDTGGIIPWTPENERAAMAIAQANCRTYSKHAIITSTHRHYGDYITYTCQFDPPRYRHR